MSTASCLSSTVSCCYLMAYLIIIFSQFVALYVVIHNAEREHNLTGLETFTVIWTIASGFMLITAILMLQNYDIVLTFICKELGECSNNQECGCCNSCNVCCCCKIWNRKAVQSSFEQKSGFWFFTGCNLLGLYLLAITQQSMPITPTTTFFYAMQFWSFFVYGLSIILYRNFFHKDESNRAAYHVYNERVSNQIARLPIRDQAPSRTEGLLGNLMVEDDEPKLFLDETWLAERIYKFHDVEGIVERT